VAVVHPLAWAIVGAEVADALRYVGQGHTRGQVVIRVVRE